MCLTHLRAYTQVPTSLEFLIQKHKSIVRQIETRNHLLKEKMEGLRKEMDEFLVLGQQEDMQDDELKKAAVGLKTRLEYLVRGLDESSTLKV